MSRSVIENLPAAKRQEIVDALLAGESLRKVAGRVGISHVQVGEYKRKVILPAVRTTRKLQALQPPADNGVSQTVSTVSLTKDVIAAAPIRSRIEQHQATLDAAILDAREEKDARGVAALIRTDLSRLELDARLTGLLDSGSHVTVNQLAVIMSPKEQEPDTIDIHGEPVTDAPAEE